MKITRMPKWWRYAEAVCAVALISIVIVLSIKDDSGAVSFEGVTAFATLATVCFLYLAWKQVKYAAEDAERPHISIMLRITSGTNRILVIKNTGKSTAINVRLTLTGVKPGLRVKSQIRRDDEEYCLDDTPLFAHGADVPAGWLYEFLLLHGKTYHEDQEELKHVRKFTIEIRYESLQGTVYEDSISIDIDLHKHGIAPKHTSAERIELLESALIPVLKEMKNEIREIRMALEPEPTHYLDGTPIGIDDSNAGMKSS